MTGCGALRRSFSAKVSTFVVAGLIVLGVWSVGSAGAGSADLAQAPQGAPPTAGTTFDVLGAIQGLGDLTVSNVQTDKDVITANVTVKGVSAQLVGFSINDQNYVAVLPTAFNFADFVPGIDGTALDEIALPSAVLIVAPAGSGSAQLSSDSLPKAVGDALAASGATSPTVEGGITLFGRIDGSNATQAAALLSLVGVSDASLPISGALDPAVFQVATDDNTSALRDAILDSLDLKVPLPAVNPQGLPADLVFADGAALRFHSAAGTDGGRVVETDIVAAVALTLANQTVTFQGEIDFTRTGGQNPQTNIALSGTTSGRLNLPSFIPVRLTDLSIAATGVAGKWTMSLKAKTTFRGKEVDLSVALAPDSAGKIVPSVSLQTPITVAEIIGSANVPGVDDIQLDGATITNGFAEAQATIKGTQVKVILFKPTPQSKFHLAALPSEFKFSTFLPQLGETPFDAATFKSTALVWVPTGDAKSGVETSGLQTEVASALQATAATLDFKEGLNLFARMDLEASGTIATLLSQVGADASNLPLRGTLNQAVFRDAAGNAQEIRNALLDSLDIAVPLPSLGLPGLPGAGTFKNGQLAIKGSRNAQNQRVIEVGVTGDLEVNLKGEKIDFALDVELDRTAGADTDLSIAGASEKPLKISMFRAFEVTELKFTASRKAGKWAVAVDGKSSINNKPIDVTVNVEPGQGGQQRTYLVDVKTNLALSDIMGGANVPGLDEVVLNELKVSNAFAEARVTVRGEGAKVVFSRPTPQSKTQIAILPDDFKISTFVPQAAGTPLDAAKFENVALIWVPKGEAKTGVQSSSQQADVAARLSATAARLDFKDGVNLFGRMELQASGQIATLLKQVGVSDVKLPLRGALDPAVFRSGGGTEAANAILDNLDLRVPLPTLALPGLPGAGSFKDGKLSIVGKRDAQGRREIDIGVKGELDVDLKGEKIVFALEVELDRTSGGDTDLSITGVSEKPLKIAMFRPFEITSLNIAANRKGGKWDVTVDGKSKLNNKPIDVAVHVITGPGTQRTYAIDVNTQLAVSDIVPALNLPGLSDVVLEKLVVRNAFVDARIKIKGEEADIVYYRTAAGAKAQIAILPDDFKLSTFISPLAGTPLDAASFDNMAFIWVPKGEGKTGVQVSSLQETVAKKLAAAGASLDFKDGLNLFGSIDFQASGQIGSLLSQVGVSQLKLPLRGTIDPAVFKSGGGAEIKNAILDNLNLTLPLPALKPPGLANFIKFADNGFLHFDGKNDGGTRTFRFQVKDGLTVSVSGKQAAFDVSFSLEKSGQQTTLALAGATKDSLSFPGFAAFQTKTLALNAVKTAGKWDIKLAATAELHQKEIDFTATLSPGQGGKTAYDIIIETQLTIADFIGGGFSIPGLSDITLEKTEITNTWAETRIKVKGEEADIVFYRTSPQAKMQIAVMPDAFTLATFIPPLANTPLDSGAFTNMAFIWVPKGEASAAAPTGIPADVDKVLKASARTHAFKEGLNLFGTFAASSSGQVGSLLRSVGVTNPSLPLSGSIDPSLFSKGTESAQIKEAILKNLDISAPLPVPKIPGAPMTFKNAHFSVTGKDKDGKHEVDVVVTGEIDVKLGSKEVDFTFEIAAAKTAGASTDVTITANSTSKVTLPFFQPLELESMNLTATRKDGKWSSYVDAKSKINNKDIEVVVTRKPNPGEIVKITTKITLADLLPSGTSIPGLSDVEFDEIDFYEEYGEFTGKLKGLDTQVTAFKRGPGNKLHIGITFGDFSVGSFIPQVAGTAINDATFESMAFVWVPKGDGEKGVNASDLPNDLGTVITKSSATIDLNPGLNLKGSLVIKPGTKIASLLNKVNIKSTSLPLTGTLSPQVFVKGAPSGGVKNAILDALDISAPLPLPSLSGAPVTFKNAHFAIKGQKKGDVRDILVAVSGDIDVKVGTKDIEFAFDIEADKTIGGGTDVTITAVSTSKVTLPFFQPLELESMNLTATRKDGKWSSYVDAKSKINNKDIEVVVTRKPNPGEIVKITTKITLADLLPSGTSIPGLSDVEFDEIDFYEDYGEFTGKLKGLDTQVTVFKRGAGNKLHIGVTFGDFTIGSFIPQVAGTAINDATFESMVFVWVPTGDGEKGVKASDLPNDLGTVITKSSSTIDLNPGLNLKGSLVIKPGTKVANLLNKINIKSTSLPLTGTLSPQVFKKGAPSGGVKNAILDALDISAPLPLPSMSGAPVTFKKAHFAIKGQKKGDVRDILVAVTGEIDVKVGSKEIDFAFEIEADKTIGGGTDVTITADSTKKVTLNLFEPLELDSMDLTATRKSGKWSSHVNAKSKLNNKEIDVVVTKTPKSESVKITSTVTLADLMPGGSSVPGLSDVEIEELDISPGFVEAKLKIKKMDTIITAFKHGGKKYMATNIVNDFDIGSFIPAIANTPLDDAKFEHMVFIWAPKSGAASDMDPTDLPKDIGDQVKVVAEKFALKPGVNVFGQMVIGKETKIGKMLSAVKINKSTLPLKGALSPSIFGKVKGGGAAIKKAILDNLDLNIPLPKLGLPGISKVANIQHTKLTLKGDQGKIDVKIAGELDVSVGSQKLVFNYDVEITPRAGKSTRLDITATEAPGTTLTVNLLEKFTVSNLSFNMNNGAGRWVWEVSGDTTLRNKPVNVGYVHDPKYERFMYINTKPMTLQDIAGNYSMPGLDDVELDLIQIWKSKWVINLEVKKKKVNLVLFKNKGLKKPYVSIQIGSISPTEFIPDSGNTPLKDIDFASLSFLYSPAKTTQTAKAANLPPEVKPWVDYSGADAVIKPGLNVYGRMTIKPSGDIGDLLKKAGITELNLPLNGGFSTSVFHGKPNTAAIKNLIYDGLDLNIPIPTPHIAEISKFVTFKNGHLRLKGKLPDGTRGIDVGVSGDIDVKIKSDQLAFFVDVEYEKAQGSSEKELSISGHTEKPWNHPVGIHWLDLKSLSISIDEKKKAGASSFDIKVKAKTKIGSSSEMDVVVDVHETNGTITDAYFEMDGPIKLGEIPLINRIPEANKFILTKLIVSEHGIEADSKIAGRATDLYVFHGSGWNIALTQKDFALTELIPPLSHTPLKHIKFPFAAVMFSEAGLNMPFSELSKVGQDALKDIFSNPSERINIKKGLAFVAGFHPDHAGGMGKTVKGMGIKSQVLVMGEISGIFGGGTPMVTLVGKLSEGGSNSLPGFMKMSKSAELDFFLTVDEDEFDLGLEVGINTKIKKDTLLFDAKLKVQVLDDGFGLEVEGQMQGMWHKPFGIPGFSLGNVTLEFGTEDGGLKLGFAGETVIANDTFTMAGDVVLSEALVPEAVAFKATATYIEMDFIEAIALNMLAKKLHFDIPPGILPTFRGIKASPARNGYPATKGTKGVLFAFVSPGAQDADLGLTSEGFAMHGSLNWLGHELGEMKLSVSPTSGIYAQGKIDNFDMGPIKLEDNEFLLKANVTSVPLLKINSNIDILGIKEKFDVIFDSTEIKIHAKGSMSPDITADFTLSLTGLDLSKAKIDIKKADFFIDGKFTLDIQKFIEGPAKKAMEEAFDEMGKGLKVGLVAVKRAEGKVNGLTKKINAERAKVRRERAAAERRLRGAENRVNGLSRDIDHDWNKYHHCHGWSKGICKARWGLRARFVEGVRDVADEALRLAERLVAHFPLDLDPRVAFYIGERDTAKAGLYLAEKTIEGLGDLDKIMKRALDKFAEALGKAADIDIKKAEFKGDLRGIITKDEPVELALVADLFGLNINEQFSFKIKDIAYDVEQLGLMGLYALDHLFEKVMTDLPKGFRRHAHAVIGRKIDAKQASHKRELAKYSKDFKSYNKTAQAITASYKAYNAAYLAEQVAIKTSGLDHDPVSLNFKNEYIEVGHTGLCLATKDGHVIQLPCNNADAANQKWSTRPAFGADSVKEARGFVYLYQQAGGACVSLEGKWTTVQKKFDNFSFPFPVFQGDNKLRVSGCVNATEYYWKVLKHGDGWMQLANRATDHCLHFANSNGVPGKAKAEWAPCVGSANQVYRIADSTSPKYHKANIALRSDPGSLCFGSAAKADAPIHLVSCRGNKVARYDYLVDIKGRVKFVNRLTGRCLQPHNYKNNVDLAEAVCTQLDYQWWGAIQVPGGWKIKNAQTNYCTEQEYWTKGKAVAQASCKNWALSVFVPTRSFYYGTYWKLGVTSARFPSGQVKFDAAYTIAERMPAYTLKKHAEERAELSRLRNDRNWAERNRSSGCTPTQNYELAYWRAREYGWERWVAEAEVARVEAQCRAHEIRAWYSGTRRIVGDDYDIAVMQRRLRQNFRPSPEPKWYVCRAWNSVHQGVIPGVVVNRKCVYIEPFSGKVRKSTSYDILFEAPGAEWVKNIGGHLPANAIPMGFWQTPWSATAYTCRTMVDDRSYIGWTWGDPFCWYNKFGAKGARNFEVLSRAPWATYKLNLTN